MLPDIIPEVRVFTYDYNANYHAEAPVETLLGHADTLLKLVNYQRQQVGLHHHFRIGLAINHGVGPVNTQASDLHCFLLRRPYSCRGTSSSYRCLSKQSI